MTVLLDKVAVSTGSGRGIGRARCLSQDGPLAATTVRCWPDFAKKRAAAGLQSCRRASAVGCGAGLRMPAATTAVTPAITAAARNTDS